jgi:hypothetical protein
MTRRSRAFTLALLAAPIATSSALAGHPTSSRLSFTSTLDGAKVLPIRSRWIVHPRILDAQVAEVDFLIDGKLRWREQTAPYVYGGSYHGGNDGFLITTWLTPGEHRFTATVTDLKGTKTADTVTARVLPAPQPPAALVGTWTRVVTAQDAKKASSQYGGPPLGRWKLVFDRVGAWELDPKGGGVLDEYDAKPGILHIYAPIQMTPPTNIPGQAGITRFGHHIITSGGTDCTNAGPFGTYKWAVTGATLTLTAIHEGCPGRSGVWEGTWTRTT